MKKVLLAIALLGLAANVFAQVSEATATNGPVITFEQSTHDFGDIFQGDKVEYTFKFANTGTEPLLITNVSVQCGCTTPKGWTRDPIPPGAKSEITVAFNSAGKSGRQNKVVTLVSNAVNPQSNQISFTTNVLEKKTVTP